MNSSGWFEEVFGFPEISYEEVRESLQVEETKDGDVVLHTKPANGSGEGRSFHVGRFETPSVLELRAMLGENETDNVCREEIIDSANRPAGLTFQHITGDVSALHRDPKNEGAVFQAASQFNALEMIDPSVSPEDGITGYFLDKTQGPACALSCPAGTLYRNYIVNSDGQGKVEQLDLLKDVGVVLGNNIQDETSRNKYKYWKMKNGYALAATSKSIVALHDLLESNADLRDAVVEQLRVGVHWDTEVYLGKGATKTHRVAQVYCSALPISYDITAASMHWQPFAKLVLEGCYEATLASATLLSRQREGQRVKVFLTKVGGGAFGNENDWISSAMSKALRKFKNEPLDVFLVHYGYIENFFESSLPPILPC